MTADEMRDQLAAALPGRYPFGIRNEVADALLPVVRKIVADELRAAADAMTWPNSQNCGPELHARADALDPS